MVSLARFVYYWLDFVVGYWLTIYPQLAQTTFVLGERYFPDVLVHPQRYGFTAPRWLIRLAAACVPSPDLLILLEDDPEVIYARKSELSLSSLARQIVAYRDELNHWGNAARITTNGGLEAVAARVCDLVLNECASRTARRLKRWHKGPGWHAFPSLARAKIWVSDRDSVSNALNLYHPYSLFGRFTKALIRSLPPPAFRSLMARPSSETANQLEYLARIICSTLGNEMLSISFSTGTPGPHRKLTAQASCGNDILGYVKIGNTSTHFELLRRELAMITWLGGTGLRAAVLPEILTIRFFGEHQLLFLSAPVSSGIQRPLQPDNKDARFLAELMSRGDEHAAASRLFEAMDLKAFLAGIR